MNWCLVIRLRLDGKGHNGKFGSLPQAPQGVWGPLTPITRESELAITRRAAIWLAAAASLPVRALAQRVRGFAETTGSVFTAAPKDPLALPRVAEIPIPPFPDINAIWGSSGRDDRGHLWFGVSAVHDHYSAHLMEYDPGAGTLTDRGSVLAALGAVRPLLPGEGQIKIHSKFIQADDGYLYFSSTDEEGEGEDGSAPPKWGSHLWRLLPGSGPENPAWEHLLAAPEGLTCATGAGRWIYALGYWNHVLYRYDTQSGEILRREVGSVGGHMCRQLLVDARGHAFVPRVTQGGVTPGAGGLEAYLIEFDPDLNPIASTRLDHYADGQSPADAHGIIGFTFLADQSIVFSTGVGYLYRIVPSETAELAVHPLGWFHPKGIAYTPSLFVGDGINSIAGVGMLGGMWDWLVFDLTAKTSVAAPFPHPFTNPVLFYGTQTRDDQGRFYLVGRRHEGEGRLPVILQLTQN